MTKGAETLQIYGLRSSYHDSFIRLSLNNNRKRQIIKQFKGLVDKDLPFNLLYIQEMHCKILTHQFRYNRSHLPFKY